MLVMAVVWSEKVSVSAVGHIEKYKETNVFPVHLERMHSYIDCTFFEG